MFLFNNNHNKIILFDRYIEWVKNENIFQVFSKTGQP